MRWTSILAIWGLFWVLAAFLVLPFGVRTHDEAGVERLPGHAESAPHEFKPGKVAVRATLLSVVLFGAYYLNYVYGWITPDMLMWARPPRV